MIKKLDFCPSDVLKIDQKIEDWRMRIYKTLEKTKSTNNKKDINTLNDCLKSLNIAEDKLHTREKQI